MLLLATWVLRAKFQSQSQKPISKVQYSGIRSIAESGNQQKQQQDKRPPHVGCCCCHAPFILVKGGRRRWVGVWVFVWEGHVDTYYHSLTFVMSLGCHLCRLLWFIPPCCCRACCCCCWVCCCCCCCCCCCPTLIGEYPMVIVRFFGTNLPDLGISSLR